VSTEAPYFFLLLNPSFPESRVLDATIGGPPSPPPYLPRSFGRPAEDCVLPPPSRSFFLSLRTAPMFCPASIVCRTFQFTLQAVHFSSLDVLAPHGSDQIVSPCIGTIRRTVSCCSSRSVFGHPSQYPLPLSSLRLQTRTKTSTNFSRDGTLRSRLLPPPPPYYNRSVSFLSSTFNAHAYSCP